MKNKIHNNFLLLLLIIILASCTPSKKIIYFQDIEGKDVNEQVEVFQPTIQIGDILSINVSAIDSETALPFNLLPASASSGSSGSSGSLNYLVNAEGKINFPVLGELKVSGYSTSEITNNLVAKLKKGYLKNPIVNIRITNFKVTVSGDVGSPGVYTIENERITIVEALMLAGDLTLQGERKNIKLIREVDGKRTIATVDISSEELFNSPYYYLAQNDIIYVTPNKSKINSSNLPKNLGVIFSSISMLITIITLINR